MPSNDMNRNFHSFVSRMWLDYCDEFSDPISAPDRLDLDEYKTEYNTWLLEMYAKRLDESNK